MAQVMGPISLIVETDDDLVSFPGSKYADPIFSWRIRLELLT